MLAKSKKQYSLTDNSRSKHLGLFIYFQVPLTVVCILHLVIVDKLAVVSDDTSFNLRCLYLREFAQK